MTTLKNSPAKALSLAPELSRKRNVVSTAITDAEFDHLTAQAREADMTVSQFIRQRLFA